MVYNYLYQKSSFVALCSLLVGLVFGVFVNMFLKQSPKTLELQHETALPFSTDLVAKTALKSKNAPVVAQSNSNVVLLKEFVLKGTITGSINAAIIDHKGKGEYVFLDTDYEGYVLDDVTNEKAVFKKSGTLYNLYLYEENGNTAVATQSVGAEDKPKVEIKSQEMFDMIKHKDGSYFIPRALVKEYLQLETIFTQIKVMGTFSNDVFDGFIIQNVHPAGIFARLGLRIGDQIKKVNDKPLKNMQEPFEYFNRLDAVDRLKLSIIRKNKEEELTYEMY